MPAVNQIDLHPYFTPIGGITVYRGDPEKSTLKDPVILRIAATYGKSAAQVMLRWHLQQGRSAIPRSIRPERIAENFDICEIELPGEGRVNSDRGGLTLPQGTVRWCVCLKQKGNHHA